MEPPRSGTGRQSGLVASIRVPPSGAGSIRTPSGPGSIVAGCFPATGTSSSRPAACWISTKVFGKPLRPDEFVVSADEKTSIQARQRCHPSLPPRAHSPLKIEHEYRRLGSWAYLAAWDVHRAKVYGRCESRSTIGPLGQTSPSSLPQRPSGLLDCRQRGGPASIQRRALSPTYA